MDNDSKVISQPAGLKGRENHREGGNHDEFILRRPAAKRRRTASRCLGTQDVLVAAALPQANLPLILSLVVYGCGLLAMLICSALYNTSSGPARRDRLRRLDHAAIFLMIAGTYTPFLAAKLAGPWSDWLLVYVWAVAGAGVMMKLIWVNRFARLSVGLYLFLGWTIIVAIEPILASMSVVSRKWLEFEGGVISGLFWTQGRRWSAGRRSRHEDE